MAETQRQMSSKDAGSAKDSSLKAQRAHGVSDAPVVSLKINQDNFFNDINALTGRSRENRHQWGCTVGKMVNKLEKPLQNKLNNIFLNQDIDSVALRKVLVTYGLAVSSVDVLRRHRRRLQGGIGCKCSLEDLVVLNES